jgi:SHS2 domain-containing protein
VSWRFLDHTADVGVEIAAPGPRRLFAEALAAFTDTVTVLDRVERREARRLRVAVPAGRAALEDLMVEWLGELLFLFETENLLFREAEVDLPGFDRQSPDGDTGEAVLTATARGERYDPDRHPIKVLVKGVTYHLLEVREVPGKGWRARVIFDI